MNKTAKLVDALLDGEPSMSEKALIADGMDWVRLHTVLVFMVVFVGFFCQYLTPFCSITHTGSMLVANQESTNKTFSKYVNGISLGLIALFFLVCDVCLTSN